MDASAQTKTAFAGMISTAYVALGKEPPGPKVLLTFFELLSDLEISDVSAALRAHMRDPIRGHMPPVPADIIRHAPRQNKAMSANEAWAIALQGRDEAATVITNNLIDHAMSACQTILDIGDKIGARMAFIAAYERAVSSGIAIQWRLSLGHSVSERASVVQEAISMGILGHDQGMALLPPPAPSQEAVAMAGLITGKPGKVPEDNKDRWHKLTLEFRAMVAADQAAKVEAARIERDRLEAERAEQMRSLGVDD